MLKVTEVSPFKKEKRLRVKRFFWKDKSGRGFPNTFNQTGVKKSFTGEQSWQGESAYSFALNADVGDEWENAANKITRVE